MPTIGPRMTALGEIDFIRAQTTRRSPDQTALGMRAVPRRHHEHAEGGQQAAGERDPQVVQEAADHDLGGRPEAAVDRCALPHGGGLAGRHSLSVPPEAGTGQGRGTADRP